MLGDIVTANVAYMSYNDMVTNAIYIYIYIYIEIC